MAFARNLLRRIDAVHKLRQELLRHRDEDVQAVGSLPCAEYHHGMTEFT